MGFRILILGGYGLFGSRIVRALSTDAARGSDTPFDERIQLLRGHRGQIDVAAALRGLMRGSSIRASHKAIDDRIQDPYCLRCQPQVMGAALDVMRQAAATLAVEANGVSDNPLVMTDTGEVISGGNFHAEPVAFAADMLAMAVCEIGSLAERRIAMLTDPVLSGLPAFLTPQPGLNSGFMIAQVTAAALVSENKQMAMPASVDSIPTSANQEDHVSMAAHAARRLSDMADNLANILGIEDLEFTPGGFNQITAGSYRVCVTAADDPATWRCLGAAYERRFDQMGDNNYAKLASFAYLLAFRRSSQDVMILADLERACVKRWSSPRQRP